eukprot:1404353-Ditylum_brightwellii.AAC.1
MAVNHVQWSDESLLFFFGKHKNNQLGKKLEEPWHVYSNPDQSHFCLVIALAKYLFSSPNLLKEEDKLFPGSNQYDHFIQIFHKTIHDNIDEFCVLGVKEGSLGLHSARKGAITL